jgi:ABC-type microcin C transport system permease subunit YejB
VAEYVLRRLVLLVPTLVGISVLVFTLVRLLPGDVIDALDPRLRAP